MQIKTLVMTYDQMVLELSLCEKCFDYYYYYSNAFLIISSVENKFHFNDPNTFCIIFKTENENRA